MLVSTHNLGSVPEFCDRAVLLNARCLPVAGPSSVFTREIWSSPSAACFGISCRWRSLHDVPIRSDVVIADDERRS